MTTIQELRERAIARITSIEVYRAEFNAQVRRTESCWWWTGRKSGSYGRFALWGHDYGAHVVAVLLDGRNVEFRPTGGVVMHTCDNGLCVRPHHLIASTQLENRRDAAIKNRTARGNGVPVRRLFDEGEIRTIRRLRDEGHTVHSLAARYGCSHTTIWNIGSRKIYQWVE